MKQLSSLSCYSLIILFFLSCGPSANEGDSSSSSADSSLTGSETTEVITTDEDRQKIVDLLHSMSPPIELSYLLNDIDLKFNSEVLLNSYQAEKYLSTTEKAQVLGLLSTDLVYCLVYNRTDLTKKYIGEIESVSTSLNLNKVIDFESLNSMSEQKIDAEEMAMEFTAQMEKVIRHLEVSNQTHLSAAISYAGWIESLHIASKVGKQTGNYDEELIDLVYYETIMAKSYHVIFKLLKDYPGYDKMLEDAGKLSELYSAIEVELNKAETVVTYKDSIASAVAISTQELNLAEGQFDEIVKTIQNIRKSIIK